MEDVALFGHLLGALLLGLARIGAALLGIGMLAVLAFGLWLVHLGGWGYGSGWIEAAIALFVAAVVLGGLGGQAPKRARQLATRLAGEGQVSDELRSLLANPAALLANYASVLLMVAILVLMVWKPGAAGD